MNAIYRLGVLLSIASLGAVFYGCSGGCGDSNQPPAFQGCPTAGTKEDPHHRGRCIRDTAAERKSVQHLEDGGGSNHTSHSTGP
jgi:hypothetical protein